MKSRLTSNLDVSLTPQQRAQAEKDERNDALIQEAVEQSAKDGPSIDVLTSDSQNYTTTYDRLAEQEAFASGDKPSLIPIAVHVGPQYPGGFHYVLSDADYEAVLQGLYCGRCLVRQPAVFTPGCPTCGFDRAIL